MSTGLRIRSNYNTHNTSSSKIPPTGNTNNNNSIIIQSSTTTGGGVIKTTAAAPATTISRISQQSTKTYATTLIRNRKPSIYSTTPTTTTPSYWIPPSSQPWNSTTTTSSGNTGIRRTMLRSGDEGIVMMTKTAATTTSETTSSSSSSSTTSSLLSSSQQQQQQSPPPPQSEKRIIPKLAYAELVLGRQVGQGGFSTVTAVNNVDLDDVYDTDEEQAKSRKDFASAVRSNKYVLKTLRTDLPDEEYTKGITDLAIEVQFLSILYHPNIIQMRGMANTDPNRSRFFLIFDRLHPTLEYKFNVWRTVVTNNTGYWIPCCGYCGSNGLVLHENWKERFTTVASIASAIDYIHSKRIIYRDLKPDNIGYNSNGIVQLFDFGLAKQIDSSVIKCQVTGCEDLYMLTGNTGSLRYMAPEVALDRPYDESVDAYSFGILFWQICSLITPYAKYSTKMHAERVVRNGERPKPDPSWPVSWITLMQSCWSANRHDRPSFSTIVTQVEEIQFDIEQEDGIVPSKTSEIRAKKKRKKLAKDATRLDVDTRLSTDVDPTSTTRRFPNNDVV